MEGVYEKRIIEQFIETKSAKLNLAFLLPPAVTKSSHRFSIGFSAPLGLAGSVPLFAQEKKIYYEYLRTQGKNELRTLARPTRRVGELLLMADVPLERPAAAPLPGDDRSPRLKRPGRVRTAPRRFFTLSIGRRHACDRSLLVHASPPVLDRRD
jgi:hypothetical protein